MRRILLNIVLALVFSNAFSQNPDVAMIDPAILASKKIAYKNGNPEIIDQVKVVVKKADEFLALAPQSVMDKNFTPTSKSKHDYMSMGPYWWPDPSKPDGLPYIRKDGERNPEIRKISDHLFLDNLETRCQFLAMAYYFTGDEKYAEKAQKLLSVWFVEPETKMNPNLNFAQAIPGLNDGRGIGIIESRSLAHLADWINLLDGSKSFSKTDKNALVDWYKQFLNWMLTSKNGIDEKNAKNNHGTHYDVQIVAFALFVGDINLAKQTLNSAKIRVAEQLEPDGKQPLELERTNAYGYSTMNLEGWFNLAQLGDKAGVDLWNYTSPKGGNINKSLNWLIPYAFEEKKREYKQIDRYNNRDMYRILVIASKKYKANYTEKLNLISKNDDSAVTDLLYKSI